MKHPPNPQKGYSLIELLVVLAIVAILAIAGISMMGNRTGGAVRGIMDELEGSLMDAHKFAVATGRDVTIVTRGGWAPGNNPMLMARGDATITTTLPANATRWDQILNDLRDGKPDLPTLSAPDKAALGINRISSIALSFRLNSTVTSMSREHMNAGIAVQGSPWWANAMSSSSNGQNEDITSVEPFASDPGFKGAITVLPAPSLPPNPLFRTITYNTEISGASKRFNSTFFIPIVGLSSGNAVPGGAMGMIVVQNNGATIYKFYNPGVRDGDGKWRRI